MKEEYGQSLEKTLAAIPSGTFELKQHNTNHAHTPLLVEHFTTQTEGKGHIDSFLLFPGIELSLHRYLAEQVGFHHAAKDFVLEINYCRRGRIGWNMRNGDAVYLGARGFMLALDGQLCRFGNGCFPWDITRGSPLR